MHGKLKPSLAPDAQANGDAEPEQEGVPEDPMATNDGGEDGEEEEQEEDEELEDDEVPAKPVTNKPAAKHPKVKAVKGSKAPKAKAKGKAKSKAKAKAKAKAKGKKSGGRGRGRGKAGGKEGDPSNEKARLCRKSAAHHKAKKEALEAGMSAEEAGQLARDVANLQECCRPHNHLG